MPEIPIIPCYALTCLGVASGFWWGWSLRGNVEKKELRRLLVRQFPHTVFPRS